MPYEIHHARNITDSGKGVSVFSWAVQAEEGAFLQAYNLAQLPFAIDHIALMPDAHQGYGMPIGGVLFADKAVVPYAVGVDIGCGVKLIETDATLDSHDGDFQATFEADLQLGTLGSGNHFLELQKDDNGSIVFMLRTS